MNQYTTEALALLECVTGGKTKKIFRNPQCPGQVFVVSADDITAGDGAKHDVIMGKGALSTATTSNVFRLLKDCGIPVAFDEQVAPNVFTASECNMLPYEVVVRRESYGSSLKRNPFLTKGHVFPKLIVEFFLKTSGRRWKKHDLPCDDPLMIYDAVGNMIHLYDPAKILDRDKPFLSLPSGEVHRVESEAELYPEMQKIAMRTFLILEKAWQLQGGKLVDFKVEFGLDQKEDLKLADVIDSDSWRVIMDGVHIDKQAYREGAALDAVLAKFQKGAEITGRFFLPKQRIIIWTGSPKDDISAITEAFYHLANKHTLFQSACISMHKEPVYGIETLNQLVQDVPNTVVIAFIGRSNGAGPTLSAATTVPVITVPANYRDFPDDVWSSLRAPSNTPVMTVLEPANAVLAALNILALQSPLLYMLLREEVEKRQVNTVRI